MKTPRFIPLHKAQLAWWIWRPWTAAPRYSQELRLLERRVAAARFGINAPPRFVGPSVHKCMYEENARVLP
jgi:hypothetical protein